MNFVKYFLVLSTLLVLTAITFFFYQPMENNIYGRALVLAFVENVNEDGEDTSRWEEQDLSIEVNSDCSHEDLAKISQCIAKNIKHAISRTQDAQKELIVLAENSSAGALLKILDDELIQQLASIVLIEPTPIKIDFNPVVLPKLIVISDVNSSSEKLISINELTSKLRGETNWVWSTQLVAESRGLFRHSVMPHMVSYTVDGLVDPRYKIEFNAESRWQHPIVDNNAFWQQAEFIESREVTTDIQRILKAFYAHDKSLLNQWRLEKYHAFNLLKYRDSLPANKQGRFVTFMNRKGHKFYLDLEKYGQYGPEFVIGIDEEDNLYRLTSFYRTKRYYSWEEGGPANDMLYAQSLGAFIHFQQPLQHEDELPYLQYSSILFESISFTDNDPYQKLTGLSDKAFRVITLNCVPCHSIYESGGAAHHLDYLTVKPQPGFAKPLLSYPRAVLDNFFFNQTNTAKLIGVNINYVEEDVGHELIAWLQSEDR